MIKFYSTKDEYGWMSNFARHKIILNKEEFPYFTDINAETNEHYYQSTKSNNPLLAKWIREAPTSYAAMMAGRNLRPKEIRKDWNDIKVSVMLWGLRFKFNQHKYLRNKLFATGDETIHEDSPTDLFWGMLGEDMLGKLLMQVREEFRIAEKENIAILDVWKEKDRRKNNV